MYQGDSFKLCASNNCAQHLQRGWPEGRTHLEGWMRESCGPGATIPGVDALQR